jgi:hypothetical protein
MAKARSLAVKQKSASGKKPTGLSEDEHHEMIAINAYYRAQKRDFHPRGEEDDWLAAEKDIAELIRKNICE